MILVTACDDDYLKYAIPMVRSFLQHNPGNLAAVYRIKPKIKAPNIKSCFFTEYATEKIKVKQSKAALAANARVFILDTLVEDLPDGHQILYLDADSIVRGLVPDCRGDVSTLHRPLEQKEELEYLISTIRMKVNYASRQFCHNWRRITIDLIENGHDSIMTCQRSFKRAKDVTREMIFEPAHKTTSDWDFAPDSVVWCAKGPRKEFPEYTREMALYA